MAAAGNCTLSAATVREREHNRHEIRQLSLRAIGSTLLLKGLEAEVAVDQPRPSTTKTYP